jgi:hypothetical protein
MTGKRRNGVGVPEDNTNNKNQVAGIQDYQASCLQVAAQPLGLVAHIHDNSTNGCLVEAPQYKLEGRGFDSR